MSELWDKDAILKELAVPLREVRKLSIYGKEGRIFLIAAADAMGYDVDRNGFILDKNGSKMESKLSQQELTNQSLTLNLIMLQPRNNYPTLSIRI